MCLCICMCMCWYAHTYNVSEQIIKKYISCLPNDPKIFVCLSFHQSNVSSKFENQISKAITSCYYAVKPRVVYNTRVMLTSAKTDCVPNTENFVLFMSFRADVKLDTSDALRRD